MSDVDAIREALTVLHRRLQEEGYGPEFGQPDPEDLFNVALPALDRMEKAQGLQHTAHTHSVSDRERRYEAALREADDLLRRLGEWDMLYVRDGVTTDSAVADGAYWKHELTRGRDVVISALEEQA